MQINLLTMIGLGLAVMFFGYFFGLFEGRGQGYKRRKKEEEEDKKTRAAIEKPLVSPPPPVVENSLLKISLDEKHQPQLDLDGQRVNTAQLNTEQRKRLTDLLLMARPWLEIAPAQKPAAPAPTPQRLAPSAPSAASDLGAKPPIAPAAAPVSGPKPSVAQPTPAPASKVEPAAPTTMVGQIDAILQARLAGTPLAGRGIRLVESPEGTVTVMVGLKSFSGVGEVNDPEIQAAIRAAIAEWEQKYTPT